MKEFSLKMIECVVLILYGYEITGRHSSKDDLELAMKHIELSKKSALQSAEFVQLICSELEEIDAQIKEISITYDLDRISKIDLAILRYAFYCMKDPSAQTDVIENSIRLSKKFSTPEASKFVHAVLDKKAKLGAKLEQVVCEG